jgi:hypothetical protein
MVSCLFRWLITICLLSYGGEQASRELTELREAHREGRDQVPVLYSMPLVAWERRYVRTSATVGHEVYLVKRVAGPRWTVLTPDLRVVSVMTSSRRTVATNAVNGVQYTAMPVLTGDQKNSYLAQATAAITANSVQQLPEYTLGKAWPRGSRFSLGPVHWPCQGRLCVTCGGALALDGVCYPWSLRCT